MRRGQEAARALALELGLVEDADPAGGARLVLCARLRGAPEPIGEVRRYVGPGPVVEVLSVRLAVAALGLEVERLLAFAAADLPLPHLSLSLTRSQPPGTPGLRTVIVDLIPRVDLAVNLGHAEAVFRPLADARAQALVAEVFELRESFEWRGLGTIPESALALRPAFAPWDAEKRWAVPYEPVPDHPACACGAILRGLKKPTDCRIFGTACTPETPIGSCMVSPEGACAAYWQYGRRSA
ncbi:MAG: hypothetical protein KC731_00525 [Myxococcales bacterium]|nr:hypothetical protein [Myxococcales bacterium]